MIVYLAHPSSRPTTRFRCRRGSSAERCRAAGVADVCAVGRGRMHLFLLSPLLLFAAALHCTLSPRLSSVCCAGAPIGGQEAERERREEPSRGQPSHAAHCNWEGLAPNTRGRTDRDQTVAEARGTGRRTAGQVKQRYDKGHAAHTTLFPTAPLCPPAVPARPAPVESFFFFFARSTLSAHRHRALPHPSFSLLSLLLLLFLRSDVERRHVGGGEGSQIGKELLLQQDDQSDAVESTGRDGSADDVSRERRR